MDKHVKMFDFCREILYPYYMVKNTSEKIINSSKEMVVYSYKISMDILGIASNLPFYNDKCIIVFVGANGSGKSTLIANLYKRGVLNYPYINADLVALKEFNDLPNEDKNINAMHFTTNMIERIIESNQSFVYETVFSHASKIDLLKMAKAKGYRIVAIHVFTNSPTINCERVKQRVLEGGHDVQENKIIDRYYRCNQNVEKLKDFADEFIIIDNSNDK